MKVINTAIHELGNLMKLTKSYYCIKILRIYWLEYYFYFENNYLTVKVSNNSNSAFVFYLQQQYTNIFVKIGMVSLW